MSAVPVREAATVVVMRPGPPTEEATARGLEVLLVRRHGRSGFMPDLWVFPGGAVDPEDHDPDPRIVGGPPDQAPWVAAVRETLEEAGVWLGDGEVPDTARQALLAGETDLPALLRAHDLTLDLERLVPWSRWVTPEGAPRRFDTWFFVAEASRADAATHDARETTAARWMRPADVLAAGPSAFPLSPPTWWTLKELVDLPSVAAARDAVRDLAPTMPVFSDVDPALGMAVNGPHPQVPRRIRRTEDGWRCTRDGDR